MYQAPPPALPGHQIVIPIATPPPLHTADTPPSAQNTVIVQPTGEYATINNKPIIDAMQALGGHDGAARKRQIDAVLAHPNRFAPPVLEALSEALFSLARKDEAAFWFYAGQLRGRYDANRTTDMTAASGLDILTERYGRPINQYTFQSPEKLVTLVRRVVEWDRTTPHDYDGRWLAPHGMDAFGTGENSKPLLAPESQWKRIAEETRHQYLTGFQNSIELIRKAGREQKARLSSP